MSNKPTLRLLELQKQLEDAENLTYEQYMAIAKEYSNLYLKVEYQKNKRNIITNDRYIINSKNYQL